MNKLKTMTAEQKRAYYREKWNKLIASGYVRKPYKMNEEQTEKKRSYNRSRWQTLMKTQIGRYRELLHKAKQRGLICSLTFDDYKEIDEQPCYYCGSTEQRYTGIDRLDSKRPYTKENSVPCCKTCNRLKMNMDTMLFLRKCQQIAKLHQ